METSEFIQLARQFQTLSANVQETRRWQSEFDRLKEPFAAALEARQIVGIGKVRQVVEEAVHRFAPDDPDALGAARGEVDVVIADTWDKSPSRIMGEYGALIERWQAVADERRRPIEQALQDFIQSQSPPVEQRA